MAEGLERLIDAYLQGEDRPTVGGVRPHVTMTVDARELAGEGPHPPGLRGSVDEYTAFLNEKGYSSPFRLQWMGPISGESAHMLACDATLTSMILNGERVPLDVGREHRTVTPAIRQSVVGPGLWLRFPWMRAPSGMDRRSSHRTLVQGRQDQPGQYRPVVSPSPPNGPPPGMGREYR